MPVLESNFHSFSLPGILALLEYHPVQSTHRGNEELVILQTRVNADMDSIIDHHLAELICDTALPVKDTEARQEPRPESVDDSFVVGEVVGV